MSFFEELKRRNVVRTAIAYVLIAWIILQVIDFMLELTDAPTWVLQVFFIAAAVGLPVVLLLSWLYEMTPEGIRREKEVDPNQSITPDTGRKLDRLIIAMLLVVIGILAVGYFLPNGKAPTPPTPEVAESIFEPAPELTPQQEPELPSIAVLPFVNMSPDADQEYFADGISEEILNSLARVDGLKVAGRTSSFAFKGRNEDLREIGEALSVAHILEGSVRKQGNRVRITAQLVKADDGFHLWSDTFDRTLDDIFAIQDEIAGAILKETRIQLLDEQSITVQRVDPAAYQNYVAAKQRIHERTKSGLEVAMKLLEDAVEIDPEFAAAWAQRGIATMLSSDGFGSYGELPEVEAQRLGKQFLDRALAINPDQAEAHAGLALYWQNQPPFSVVERQRSIESARKALAINPNLIDASHWLQRALQGTGEYQEALSVLEAIVERDPLYWPGVSNLVLFYARQNRMAEAQDLNDRTQRYRPELTFRQNAMILNGQGRHAEALTYIDEVWNQRKDPLIYIDMANTLFGLHEYERAVDLEGAPDDFYRAIGLGYLGRVEEGVMSARRALRESGEPAPMIITLSLGNRPEELVAFFQEHWESPTDFFNERGYFRGYGYEVMLHLAMAFKSAGEDAWFREAMNIVRTNHDEEIALGFNTMQLNLWEAAYWALAGDPERAMANIDMGLDKGFAYTPRFSRLIPQLRELEGLPRYEAQQARAMAHLRQQRALAGLEPLEANL